MQEDYENTEELNATVTSSLVKKIIDSANVKNVPNVQQTAIVGKKSEHFHLGDFSKLHQVLDIQKKPNQVARILKCEYMDTEM